MLDDLDKEIIRRLQRDGRVPYTSIAGELGVAEATIRKRVTRLLENDVIQISGVVNPAAIGATTVAFVGIHVEGQEIEAIIKRLSEFKEVRYLGICAGTYDMMIEILVGSNEELFHFLTHKLRTVDGISHTDTSMVLKVAKSWQTWGAE